MTTLAVACFTTAFAGNTYGSPQPYIPQPYHPSTGCSSSRDCRGAGVYCYLGDSGNPNFCAKASGYGSLCQRDSDCGWIGQGYRARAMNCQYGVCIDPWRHRYLEDEDLEKDLDLPEGAVMRRAEGAQGTEE